MLLWTRDHSQIDIRRFGLGHEKNEQEEGEKENTCGVDDERAATNQ